jgi:hypothetical protein
MLGCMTGRMHCLTANAANRNVVAVVERAMRHSVLVVFALVIIAQGQLNARGFGQRFRASREISMNVGVSKMYESVSPFFCR